MPARFHLPHARPSSHLQVTRGKTPLVLLSRRPVSGRLFLFLLLLLLLLVFSRQASADIALIVATEEQARAARKVLMPAGEPLREGGRKIDHGFFEGERVHLVLSGAGLVPTAQTTTMLLSKFPVDVVISYGIAGGLRDHGATEPGSFVVALEVKQHNLGVSRDAGSSSEPRPDLAPATHQVRGSRGPISDLAERVAASLLLADVSVTTGTLVCGDEFIASPERRRDLRTEFDAVAVDMNGSGITIPADSYGVPWLVVRRITDRADARAGADFAENTRKSSDSIDEQVLKILLAESVRAQ